MSALKEKHARLQGELLAIGRRYNVVHRQIATIRDAIKLFDDACDPGSITPIRWRADQPEKWFTPGQCSRTVLDVLRTAGEPLTARQIALEAMRRCGIETDSAVTNKRVTLTVRAILRGREGRSVVGTADEPKRWSLAPDVG